MRHLRPHELIDFADPRAAATSVVNVDSRSNRHLQACESCRRRVAELRATIAAAEEADVPEPSPLFWDHLSARVRERVASETLPSRWTWIDFWRSRRVFVPVTAFAVVLLGAVLATRFRPDQSMQPGGASAVSGEITALSDNLRIASDPSLSLIADLADSLDWDDAVEAGLNARDVAVDRAVTDLNDRERVELQKLLKEELSRSGA